MTLKEIAKEAGVSVSTVSRVINRKGPHVARPELQNRIWEIVGRTGYVPTTPSSPSWPVAWRPLPFTRATGSNTP